MSLIFFIKFMRNTTLTIVMIFFIVYTISAQENKNFITVFERSGGLETATYQEVIGFYQQLADAFNPIELREMGLTDSGKPLHMVVLSPDAQFEFSKIRENRTVLLINNGIHPGESDGIDATMMLFRDIAQGKIEMPKNVVLATIPVYNVGGSLNRNSHSRTNQNGPKAYGFRGNARNYDLNRDFIKCDTRNARTFTKIFHLTKPDVFIDNHVSNGADYQYILTHLFTQHNKLGGRLGNYVQEVMMPALEKNLTKKNWDITPYVNVFNSIPDRGFSQFMDYPRYSTGYTALFNTLGMLVETHMLKPYKERVEGTYELLISMMEVMDDDARTIIDLRTDYYLNIIDQKWYPLDWKLDSTKFSTLNFKGYEGEFVQSNITGQNRLKYNREKPFTKQVKYFDYFVPADSVTVPKGYVIPQGWHEVIDLLKLNQIELIPLKKDTTFTVEVYHIAGYDTRKSAYEGHYQHFNTNVTTSVKEVSFRAGDYLIKTDQPGIRYILETLEPQAPDSFFNWNFFDTILQQKEGFSPYVWEDMASEFLNANPDIQAEFKNKKSADRDFADSWYAQLDWIHKQSPYYEKAHLRYPIFRY